MILDNGRVNSKNLRISLGENVLELLEGCLVWGNLLRGEGCTKTYVLGNAKSNIDIYIDGGINVIHFYFLEGT